MVMNVFFVVEYNFIAYIEDLDSLYMHEVS